MKKILLMATVTTALSLVNTASAATNGTVTFSGKLSDQTCQVKLNGGSSASGTVALPTVQKEKLAAFWDSAGKTPFTLELTGCKASTSAFGVTAFFPTSAYASNATGVLFNQETGTTAAKYVSLRIYQKIGSTETVVVLNKPITDSSYKYTTVPANTTSATMYYAVEYVNSYSGYPATAGKVKSSIIYELAYQ